MCFSATASFIASAGLGGIGAASLAKANKRNFLLALAPILFSIQQLIEGLLWTVDKSSMTALYLGYVFLFFAYILWPVYMPLGIYLHEKNITRKRFALGFLILGSAVSIHLLWHLALHPLTISVDHHHLVYVLGGSLGVLSVALYIIAICGVFFISSSKALRVFGVITIISWVSAYLITQASFASVWCFFAAIISSLSLIYITREAKQKNTQTKK